MAIFSKTKQLVEWHCFTFLENSFLSGLVARRLLDSLTCLEFSLLQYGVLIEMYGENLGSHTCSFKRRNIFTDFWIIVTSSLSLHKNYHLIIFKS